MGEGNISDIRFYLARRGEQGIRRNREGKLIQLQERLIERCLIVEPGSIEFFRRLEKIKHFGGEQGEQLVDEVFRRQKERS